MTIKYIVIHCSDTPNEREHTAKDIHRWHKERGWDGIGYHYVIRRNGLIENGRPEYWEGAHVKGHNHEAIGICLIGRDQFTPDQLLSLTILIRGLKCKYGDADVVGHYELDSSKTCPNLDVKKWWRGKA